MAEDEDLETGVLPVAFTWAEYIARWVADRGGWTQLADELIHRAGEAIEIADDPQTVERGLRRLARREHKSGGQYGRWMLRYFGFTTPVEEWVKWMGQYHTRFADLPSALRLEHLLLWNRPPIAESRLACWIHIGIALAHLSRLDRGACEESLQLAERLAANAGAAARIEISLLRAQLETDAGDTTSARRRYAAIHDELTIAALPAADDRAYRARLQYQRALHHTRPLHGEPLDVLQAKALYEAIVEEPYIPFVSFRKSVGLAYCAWQLGQLDEAARLAALAAQHAGDGGLIRMRVMALNMLSRVVTGEHAVTVNERARRMATLLEDEELLRRVADCVPVS